MSKMLTPLLILVVAVLAVALFLRGSEVMYSILSVNSTYATLNLTDSGPGINITCYDVPTSSTSTILLVGGDRREVVCNGTADDSNGNTELAVVSGYFSTNNKKNCTADTMDCYVNNTCGFLSSPNATAKYWECRFWLWYNAENTTKAGTWVGNATIYSNGATGTKNASATYVGLNVSELLAIGVPSLMSFSQNRVTALALGINDTLIGSSSCPQCVLNISNYGNIMIDLMVNASTWTGPAGSTCGNLKADHIHINITDNTWYNESYPLNLTPIEWSNAFNLAENNTAGLPITVPPWPSVKNVFMGIGLPIGVSGSCQSTIWFTAIASN